MEHEDLRQYVRLVLERIRSKAPGTRWDIKTQDVRHVSKFNFKEFKSFDELDDMRTYANNRLEPIGEGSAREVYVLSGKHVLKLARNKAGIDQNKEEVDVYTDPETKSIVAKIFDFDKDFFWISSEMARPFTTLKELDFALGLQNTYFDEMVAWTLNGSVRDITKREPEVEGLEKFCKALVAVKEKFDLIGGDLIKPDSWGRAPDGHHR